MVQQYRAELKEEVTKALESGRLQRGGQPKQQPELLVNQQNFPALDGKLRQAPWGSTQASTNDHEKSDSTKALLLINNTLSEVLESNRRLEEKMERIDVKLSQTILDLELHQATMVQLIEHVRTILINVVGPVIGHVKPELLKSKSGAQSICDDLRDLKAKLIYDYEGRRKQSLDPSVQDKNTPAATTTTMAIDDNLPAPKHK